MRRPSEKNSLILVAREPLAPVTVDGGEATEQARWTNKSACSGFDIVMAMVVQVQVKESPISARVAGLYRGRPNHGLTIEAIG